MKSLFRCRPGSALTSYLPHSLVLPQQQAASDPGPQLSQGARPWYSASGRPGVQPPGEWEGPEGGGGRVPAALTHPTFSGGGFRWRKGLNQS